ncbi:se39 [Alphabaculovirus alterspexiguae]|uniref:Se39 n=1 Tax=Spodoptera exigua multiple nucleopolyhedrovirus TaxID=10454 RepID=A0A3G2JTY3_9ABAC|nr:se39 [Spodoptera exigua multiple nucleopolyhedrovirus]AYN44999.1 se39 [Spodoptera exigua multiple nucleopolyhedrovirus]
MSTYKDQMVKAQQKNIINRIANREINGTLDKFETALSTNRLYCIMDKKNQSLNNDNRKCPYLYEAESIDFSKSLYRTREIIKRCVICTRALHLLFDLKRNVCSFCNCSTGKK